MDQFACRLRSRPKGCGPVRVADDTVDVDGRQGESKPTGVPLDFGLWSAAARRRFGILGERLVSTIPKRRRAAALQKSKAVAKIERHTRNRLPYPGTSG